MSLKSSLMSMYTIKLNKKQLQVIQQATNLLLRVELGQWREIQDHLPLKKDIDYNMLHQHFEIIGQLLSTHMVNGINGWSSSLGIGNEDLPESTTIATDIHDTIRHKLSWDDALKDGIVPSEDAPRQWSQMLGVSYDTPFHWSKEPLPVIDKLKDETN